MWHRGPVGPLKHLEKEAREAQDSFDGALKADHSKEELADCLFLILDANWRAGFTPDDLLVACERKLDKNRLRIWPDWRTADPSSAIEHDRTGERIVCGTYAEGFEPCIRDAGHNGPCAHRAKKGPKPADIVFNLMLWVLSFLTAYVLLTRFRGSL